MLSWLKITKVCFMKLLNETESILLKQFFSNKNIYDINILHLKFYLKYIFLSCTYIKVLKSPSIIILETKSSPKNLFFKEINQAIPTWNKHICAKVFCYCIIAMQWLAYLDCNSMIIGSILSSEIFIILPLSSINSYISSYNGENEKYVCHLSKKSWLHCCQK